MKMPYNLIALLFVCLSGASQTLGQKPTPTPQGSSSNPPINVTVTNDPTRPVPVTGSITVGNLGDNPLPVKITNSAAEPSPVTGNVTVSNLGAPLLVRDADNPAIQPFNFTDSNKPFSEPNYASTSFTVPAGKRLVVESASAQVRAIVPAADLPNKKLTLRVITDSRFDTGCCLNGFNYSFLPLTYIGEFGSASLFAGTIQTRQYVDAGKTVRVEVLRNLIPLGTERVDFYISGYFIDM